MQNVKLPVNQLDQIYQYLVRHDVYQYLVHILQVVRTIKLSVMVIVVSSNLDLMHILYKKKR